LCKNIEKGDRKNRKNVKKPCFLIRLFNCLNTNILYMLIPKKQYKTGEKNGESFCLCFFREIYVDLHCKLIRLIMESEKVCKEGIVRKVQDDRLWVEVVVSSACGGCAAKSLCNISEKKNELVEAVNLSGEDFSIGETVQIQMMQKLANKAVVLGYLLPFIVLIVGLFGCYALTHIEWLSVLVGIGLTAIYYVILKLMDKRLAQQFTLYVSKKSE